MECAHGKREGARAVPLTGSGGAGNVRGARGPAARALARKSDAARGARSLATRALFDATTPDRTSGH